MAGKSGCLHGLVHDATPFRFNEKNTAIDHFGQLLTAGGYNYYGTERLYSGVDGREMTADIFMGVVHYQRLRHMVSDKWQVRSTGPIDNLTHQPVKGRKRGGGVRFGEMERDALIAHGATFLLQDRLLHCSDKYSVSKVTQPDSGWLMPVKLTEIVLFFFFRHSYAKHVAHFWDPWRTLSNMIMMLLAENPPLVDYAKRMRSSRTYKFRIFSNIWLRN